MARTLFYSYAHEDESLRDKLEEALALLRQQGVIDNWHDRKIPAGAVWEDEISENLELADVILLLISASFINSDYCYGKELTRALERQQAEEAIVVPIVLRACDWHSAPFGQLQALPTDGKAVTSWDNQDEAFADIAKHLRNRLS